MTKTYDVVKYQWCGSKNHLPPHTKMLVGFQDINKAHDIMSRCLAYSCCCRLAVKEHNDP